MSTLVETHLQLVNNVVSSYIIKRGLYAHRDEMLCIAAYALTYAAFKISKGIKHDNVTGYILLTVKSFLIRYRRTLRNVPSVHELNVPVMDHGQADVDGWEYLFSVLNEEQRNYAKLKIAGFTDCEISHELGLSRTTTHRLKQSVIRALGWTK